MEGEGDFCTSGSRRRDLLGESFSLLGDVFSLLGEEKDNISYRIPQEIFPRITFFSPRRGEG